MLFLVGENVLAERRGKRRKALIDDGEPRLLRIGECRPVPREVAMYTLADRRRLSVNPGITCIWQISGRAEIDFPGQVLLDVNYIESQSLSADMRILAKTPRAVVFGPGAY